MRFIEPAIQPGDRDDAPQLQALGGQMRGVDSSVGAWYCFRDLGVNKSNTHDTLT